MKKFYSFLTILLVIQTCLSAQINGTKTINPAGSGPDNYTTFAAAIGDINSFGVGSGGVIFNVAPGTNFYEANIIIITTTSGALNPIVFQKSGEGENPIIYGKAVGGGSSDFILGVSGSDYITFNGIDLFSDPAAVTDADKIEYGYEIVNNATNGSDHITIKNCKISIGRRTDNTGQDGIFIYQNTTSIQGINSNILIDNVTLTKGRMSVSIIGQSIPNENIEIKNCKFGEVSSVIQPLDYGSVIYFSKIKNVSFHDNEIQNVVTTNLYILQILNSTGESNIYNNKMHNFRTTSTADASDLFGIYTSNSDANAIVNIYNNLIYDFDGAKSTSTLTASTYWNIQIIDLNGASKFRVLNNTVVGRSANQHENTILCWVSNTSAEIKNNIFADYSVPGTNSYRTLFLYDGDIENNLFWIDESLTNNFTFRGGNTNYKFREWQKWTTVPSPGYFLSNMSANPNFSDGDNFDFRPMSPSPASNNGQTVSFVNSSLNGIARNVSNPDIGAYEGDFGPSTDLYPPVIRFQPIPSNSLSEIKLTAEIKDNVGVTTSNLWYRAQGTLTDFIKVPGVKFGNIWEFTFPALASGPYEYFVCAKDASDNIISNGYMISGLDISSTGLAVNNPGTSPDYIYSFLYNQAPVNGTYTVGTGGNFASLTQPGGLFAAINSSVVTGNISVTIISNLDETGEIALKQWRETGAGNYTLTIKPSSTAMRTIYNSTTSPISILGADRLVIDGSYNNDNLNHIKFVSDASNPLSFNNIITNGCDNITIRNCDFYSTALACVVFLGSYHSDILIENINSVKGSSGISLSNVTRPVIRNCTLGNTDLNNSLTLRGIYLNSCTDILVERNTIRNVVNSADNSAVYGIWIYNASGGTISRNKITGVKNNSSVGSGISNGLLAEYSKNVTISNNIISGINGNGNSSASGYQYGIKGIVFAACDNIRFYYNTVNLYGTGNTVANGVCYSMDTEGSANMDICNNILSNTIDNSNNSYTAGVVQLFNDFSNIYRNNIYYLGGSKAGWPFRILNEGQTLTLRQWQSYGYVAGNGRDLGSGYANPLFTNYATDDISLQNISPALNSAKPVTVTIDFNGNPRSVTTPDIGAIEDNSMVLANDLIPPVIDVIPFTNSPNTTPTFSATITDNTGVTASKMWYRAKGSSVAFTDIAGVKQSDNIAWNFTVTNALTLNTEYEYFICARDASGNIITNGISASSLDATAVGLLANNPAANPAYVRSFKVSDLSIALGSIAGAPFYVSNTRQAPVNIPYTITGSYSSNTFEAYLSTSAGSFTGELKIGSIVSDLNGTINAFIPAGTISGVNYQIRVTSTNPSGVISNISPVFQIIKDDATPVVILTSSSSSPVYLPFTVTIDFNEEVQGFTQSMINVINATLSDFSTVIANRKFTVLVTPLNSGTVAVKVPGNSVKDLADNFNGESNTINVSYIDLGVPHLNISAVGDVNYFNTPTVLLTFTFDQDITGFTSGDISVTNGSVSGFASVNGSTYTATLTPAGQGLVNISVADNAAINGSSKGNSASSLNLTYDNQKPGVSLSRVSGSGKVNSLFGIYVDFTEEIKRMNLDKLTVTNGIASDLVKESGTRYRVTVSPNVNEGTVTISFLADKITDMADNLNTAASDLNVTVDKIAPTVVITRTSGSGPVNETFNVTFTFSEDVTGFDVADIAVSNGSSAGFVATSPSIYKVFITPSMSGDVIINTASNVAQDLAGNPNSSATPLTILIVITGIEKAGDDELNVYPNPSSGLFKIETGNVSDQTIKITDLNGKLVFTNVLRSIITEINLQNLPKGTYLLQVIDGKKIYTKKIILIR